MSTRSIDREYIFSNSRSADRIATEIREAATRLPGLVFTYPPICLWSHVTDTTDLNSMWKRSGGYTYNLYVHIPFCKQKCTFCYYSVAVVGNEDEEMWRYLKCLEIEAKNYREAIGNVKFDTVFIGGGTPSRLSVDQIRFLFERVVGAFDLKSVNEITFECSPDSITVKKATELVTLGVSRLSMGVQSFDKRVLTEVKRDSNVETILDTFYSVSACGFNNINIDLIAGVALEDERSLQETFDTIEGMNPRPSQVTLFTLSVRKGSISNKIYRSIDRTAMFRRSLSLYRIGKVRLKDLGYWQYSRNLFPSTGIFRYQDNVWGENGHVLGLGASAYSHGGYVTYQNVFSFREYMKRVNDIGNGVDRIHWLSTEEAIRRHMVLAMKHAHIDMARFNSCYEGLDLMSAFPDELAALCDAGVMTRKQHVLEYADKYLDIADTFARLFFSPAVNNLLVGSGLGMPKKADPFHYTI